MFGPVSEGMRLFRKGSNVAVVGYSEKTSRAVCKVTKYLLDEGNKITGVTPRMDIAATTGVLIKHSLAELETEQDIIQVWRNSAALPQLAEEIKKLPWKPKLVWCQQGVVDILFQEELEKVGIPVVMDACPYALRSFL